MIFEAFTVRGKITDTWKIFWKGSCSDNRISKRTMTIIAGGYLISSRPYGDTLDWRMHNHTVDAGLKNYRKMISTYDVRLDLAECFPKEEEQHQTKCGYDRYGTLAQC